MGPERGDLLDRVVADVARHGISDRSLRDLARGAGTSHRMLIYHFGSRDGLIAAIVRTIEADQRALLRRLAGEVDSVGDLTRALWRHVSAPPMRPFVRLFFESLAYATGGPGGRSARPPGPGARPGADADPGTGRPDDAEDRTAPWLGETVAVAADLGVALDPAAVRLGVAAVRGLLIDVLATGDTEAATAALERLLAALDL